MFSPRAGEGGSVSFSGNSRPRSISSPRRPISGRQGSCTLWFHGGDRKDARSANPTGSARVGEKEAGTGSGFVRLGGRGLRLTRLLDVVLGDAQRDAREKNPGDGKADHEGPAAGEEQKKREQIRQSEGPRLDDVKAFGWEGGRRNASRGGPAVAQTSCRGARDLPRSLTPVTRC